MRDPFNIKYGHVNVKYWLVQLRVWIFGLNHTGSSCICPSVLLLTFFCIHCASNVTVEITRYYSAILYYRYFYRYMLENKDKSKNYSICCCFLKFDLCLPHYWLLLTLTFKVKGQKYNLRVSLPTPIESFCSSCRSVNQTPVTHLQYQQPEEDGRHVCRQTFPPGPSALQQWPEPWWSEGLLQDRREEWCLFDCFYEIVCTVV